MEIGIIGLGAMGRAMARNLAHAGHGVKAWNRSGGTVDGVTTVASPVDRSAALRFGFLAFGIGRSGLGGTWQCEARGPGCRGACLDKGHPPCAFLPPPAQARLALGPPKRAS